LRHAFFVKTFAMFDYSSLHVLLYNTLPFSILSSLLILLQDLDQPLFAICIHVSWTVVRPGL